MKLRRIIVPVLVILSPFIFLSACKYQDTRRGSRFGAVSVGMPAPDVIDLLGFPDVDERCGATFGRPYDVPDCMRDLVYSSAGAPLIPQHWTIFLDRNDRVAGKYAYSSP